MRRFLADEVTVVGGPEADWLDEDRAKETLARLGLPVSHLAGGRP